MAQNLPLELISQVAECLHSNDYPLSQYTVVCRQWQAAFEPFIYSSLTIYSEDVENMEAYGDAREVHSKLEKVWGTEFYYPPLPDWCLGDNQEIKKPKRALSLSQFTTLISGASSIRQAWIHYLKYRIVVPFLIEDWKAVKGEHYSYKNPVREANDKAFESGIIGLFKVLSSWSKSHHVSLELSLFGCEVYGEPCTQGYSDAGEYEWDYTNGRSTAVQPYRACFPLNNASGLSSAPCISQLLFLNESYRNGANRNHRIWAGTIFQIIVCCPTITELELDLNEYTRPDHEGLMLQRRQAVAEGLKKLPHSLRVFPYKNETEMNWKQTMPALNLLPPSGVDDLSINLRHLSFRLRELRIEQTALSFDFLCSLDNCLKPIANTSSLYWPHLEIIHFELVPRVTPSGEWLFHYTPQRQAEVDEIDDWEAEICDSERGWLKRQLIDQDAFHQLFISMGYAVQQMPRLAQIKLVGDFNFDNTFNFFRDLSTGTFTARWESESLYEPNEQVASAWKFRLEDMEVDDKGRRYGAVKSTVKFSIWPPLR